MLSLYTSVLTEKMVLERLSRFLLFIFDKNFLRSLAVMLCVCEPAYVHMRVIVCDCVCVCVLELKINVLKRVGDCCPPHAGGTDLGLYK